MEKIEAKHFKIFNPLSNQQFSKLTEMLAFCLKNHIPDEIWARGRGKSTGEKKRKRCTFK